MAPNIEQPAVHVRPLDPQSTSEVELVARRMRDTLEEVLDPETGRNMYTMEWLVQRVLWHLDPVNCRGAVFVAEDHDGRVAGHTIVRVEHEEGGPTLGLFSTTYVAPEFRRRGIADRLLDRGEAWMIEQGMTLAATYTDRNNRKLIRLYERRGYKKMDMPGDFVRLSRPLI
jgi:GNAT superfamily N-acetyltransferase